jgi:hypothetical protein
VELTTDQKGSIAEAEIAAAAIRLGIGVLKPLSDGTRYDLVFDLGGALLRVQCKWATCRGDVVLIRTRSSRRTATGQLHRCYTAAEIDAIAAYCAELDRSFFIPSDVCDGRAGFHLRLTPTLNNQHAGVNWADDFDFAAKLSRLKGP